MRGSGTAVEGGMPEGGSSSDQAAVTSESTVGVGAKRKERPAEELTPVPEEMSLPVAAIMRIIKAKLPDGVQIGKEAKTAFSKACSIFIMYVTTIANDLAKESKRSTVTAADVLHALKEPEFDDFLPMVENSLFAYRENDKAKALEAAAKRAARDGDEGAPPSTRATRRTTTAPAVEDAEVDAQRIRGFNGQAPGTTSHVVRLFKVGHERLFYSDGRSLVPRERTTYAGEECGRQCDGSSYKPAS